MDKFQNYSADGRYYISTIRHSDTLWETSVFLHDRNTQKIDFSQAVEELSSNSKEEAISIHQKTVWKWNVGAHPEDVLGIGEGYY